MISKGVFLDVVGLSYRCGGLEGSTTTDYEFSYEPGTVVSFFIGPLVLGETIGKAVVTVSDLVFGEPSISDPSLLIRARLLYSLTPGLGFERPIIIDAKIRDTIAKYASKINLDAPKVSDMEPTLSQICDELGLWLKPISHVRNQQRRAAAGCRVLRDIKIPTRDGQFAYGDVYLPLEHGKRYPVLVTCTCYGKRVVCSGPDLENLDDIAAFEEYEDNWHSTTTDTELIIPNQKNEFQTWTHQRVFECNSSFNSYEFVPHGYAMVKIDPRGVTETPGTRGVPGQITNDIVDAIEWAISQNWSNGCAALVGSSFGANVQWKVAQMRPKGLKCFVPYATDVDVYRETAYPGGIPASGFIDEWTSRVCNSSRKWKDYIDLAQVARTNPFDNKLWRMVSNETEDESLPCFVAAAQIFLIHGRGAYEAFMKRSPKITHIQMADCDYYPWPNRESSGKILAFLDRYLNDADNDLESVGIQMRLGHKEWYWRKESNWPVPDTQYTKWHLQADGGLALNLDNAPEKRFPYSSRSPHSGKSGVSFHSPAFTEDVNFAGHFAATLGISSAATEMDVVATLWPVDEHGNVVPYGAKGEPEALAKGMLRASHRKLDPAKSLPFRPYHTHTQEDHAPLERDEVVQVQIEMFPSAGRVCEGWHLRLDVTPSESQPDIAGYEAPKFRIFYGEEHDEVTNTVHVGGGLDNFFLCPMVPVKDGPRNVQY